ncbi:MAG: hypothetical protein CL608_33835 [Anaerolineaceae bacterium]|nr:hypothetical protein [Anaerolineaceae bacterium]
MKSRPKSTLFFFLFLGLLLAVSCTSGGAAGEPTAVPATPIIDEATGLELNPIVIPDGEFVVQGTITAVNLIPQDEPLIKVMAENGQLYQVRSQPVPQITYEDGTAVPPLEIKNGQRVRATVQQSESGGLGGEPVLASTNLIILPPGNDE